MARPSPPIDNVCLDAQAVQHCVTYSLPQLTRLEAAGKFPKRIHIGPGRIGWSLREILNWMQSKVDERPVGPMSPKVTIDTADRFVAIKELRTLVLYSPTSVRSLELEGRFPGRIRLSVNRVVWLEREVTDWVEAQRKRTAAEAALKTYHVRLCRPRFEVANVTVRAHSLDAAEQTALAKAKTAKSGWHLLPYEPETYRPHVANCLQDKSAKHSPHTVENMLGGYHASYVRYLMLYADTKLSEGTVLFQPWFTDEKQGRLAHELASGWMEGINRHVKPITKARGRNKQTQVGRSR